jgi:hypothetical protein
MRLIAPATALLLASSAAMADCNHPTRVGDAPGEFTAESEATPATIDCYQVTAQAGQQLSVSLAGSNHDASFAVFAPGWQASCNAVDDCDITGDQLSPDAATDWTDKVSDAGAYLIVIDNAASDADYHLNVTLRDAGLRPAGQ